MRSSGEAELSLRFIQSTTPSTMAATTSTCLLRRDSAAANNANGQ
ncbi:Uncharacterised protein [Mycobacteroides abscessus subsp. abscessus]|nr:Uncharacterised protein [Mycobacteroides abscessus subsp. abscessus]